MAGGRGKLPHEAGRVRDGLDYFHFARFAERVQTLLDSVRATPDESPGRRPSTRGEQP